MQQWRWRPHLTAANAITTASLAGGITAIWEAASGGVPLPAARLRLVIILIAACAVLDAADGPVARRTGTAGPFGEQLDNLADLTAFGIAPCLAFYTARLHAVPVAGAAAALAWAVCAAWRLARHPLCHTKGAFCGLPVPAAAVLVSLTSLAPAPAVTFTAVTAASAAMITTVPFPTWHAALTRLRSLITHRRS